MKIHVGYLLFSVSVAIVLWALAASTLGEWVEKTYIVPIKIYNQTPYKLKSQSVETVSLRVRLSRERMRRLKIENFVVRATIPEGTERGQYIAFLQYELPANTSFVSMFPDEVIVELR